VCDGTQDEQTLQDAVNSVPTRGGAITWAPGTYNVVDDDPTPQSLWLPAFARAVGAPEPPQMTEEGALEAFGPDTVYYATRLRGASNQNAKRELNFRPRPLEWLSRVQPQP